jgi:transposase InsO family protein
MVGQLSADASARDIAAAAAVDERSVQRRAEVEKWIFSEEPVLGGCRRLYPVGLLPADIRARVFAHLANRDAAAGLAAGARAELTEDIASLESTAGRSDGLSAFATLTDKRRLAAESRATIVDLFHAYLKICTMPRYRALALFERQYNESVLDVPPEVRAVRPRVSSRSIENWEAQLLRGGLARLAGRQGKHRKGTGTIDANAELRDFILGMLVKFPHLGAKQIMRGVEARFVAGKRPNMRTLQRWLERWKKDNAQLFTAVKNPDEWRSKFQAAGGNASAHIVRLNQRWESDGTKGDLRLSDGKRHTITSIIDVYSRRIKLHVSRTSSAAAVASALRRAILDWGVPEQLGTDNGSDFVSKHIKHVVAGLRIEHDIAPPYTPEHKPFVERAFGTFCRDMVEMLPGYVGHNVADREAIRARQSFSDRMMKVGGEPVELRVSPEELQEFCDRWTDVVYGRDPHAGLGKMSPFDKAASWTGPLHRINNERALDVLLLPAPGGDGIRTIGKKGIKVDGAWFETPELGGLEGSDVRVLYDDADIGQIYVFSLDGPFIAKAICPERSIGVSRAELVTQRQAHQRRAISEQKAMLRAAAKDANTDTIVADILRQRGDEADRVVAFPTPSIAYTTPDLDEAALAAFHKIPEPEPESAAVLAMEARIAADLDPLTTRIQGIVDEENSRGNVVKLVATDLDRFRHAFALTARINAGERVPDEEWQWMKGYVKSPEYLARQKLFLDFGWAALEK